MRPFQYILIDAGMAQRDERDDLFIEDDAI